MLWMELHLDICCLHIGVLNKIYLTNTFEDIQIFNINAVSDEYKSTSCWTGKMCWELLVARHFTSSSLALFIVQVRFNMHIAQMVHIAEDTV